jgi:tRNA nucleotidyltransferase/poly(A) polymerase
MPDYIYLLENRLSADQQSALRHLREAAREAEMILFLAGDAVRDLTSGNAVRDIEIIVQGDALKLKPIIEKVGGKVWGEDHASHSLYLCFPGTVRVDVLTAQSVEYPKPGQPVYHRASIQEELRRHDFTVNAMALSLNEGSFGLLVDPLNGAADIESRTLRLVSNYGFLEEPANLIRATRYMARLGWELDPRSKTRYENAKGEGVMEFLSDHARSRELEQIGHEEDGLKILKAMETEDWMKILFPAWTSSKADEDKLKALHDLAVELLVQGVHADISAAQMQLLTAKMSAKDLAALKKQLLRPGFVEEWNSLDSLAAGFAKVLLAKENQTPSISFKLFSSYDPEAVLWLGFTSKDPAIKERFNLFLKVWPETRQRIPHALMQEMRIKPELANYSDIVQSVFLELIDGHLTTPEEIRAFLEPHSPPAPPPQVTIKRTRAKRGAEAKVKDSYDEDEDESDDRPDSEEDLDDMGGDDDDIGLGIPKIDLEPEPTDEPDIDDTDSDIEDEEDDADESEEPPTKGGGRKSAPGGAKKQSSSHAVAEPPAKRQTHAAKHVPADPAPSNPSKHAPTPVKKAAVSVAKHASAKPEPKKAVPAKSAAKSAPAKKTAHAAPAAKPHKPAPKKPAPKPAKKH